MKTAVLEAIGETALSRVAQVNKALAANDRLKYFLTLLQAALNQADSQVRPPPSFAHERIACGIEDAALDDMVATARRNGERYRLPGATQVLARIADELSTMAAPVIAERSADDPLARRVQEMLTSLPDAKDDLVDGAMIQRMTRVGQHDTDSLHRLIMDLHKALNALAVDLAEENLDGASVYRLTPEDRPLVSAFMAGVNRTAALKFGHPGLATMATRCGGRLVIQNDIGTTDAHVVVIHVEGRQVTLTYTDVHIERTQFLRRMLSRLAITWSGERPQKRSDLADGNEFVLLSGRFEASGGTELRSYLEYLGSRLVFLIDWNRARKQLRGFLPSEERTELLTWAAEAEIGHRGFLELGGARLVNEAIEATAGSAVHFGDRLCDVLGTAATVNFLRFAFRAAADGLRARHSRGLVRDRVEAELAAHFSNEGKRLLRVAADHAGLVFEIALLVRDGVRPDATKEELDHIVPRARAFEHDADQLIIAAREAVQRRRDQSVFIVLLEAADDAADQLEEAAFLVHLLARTEPSRGALEALAALADILVAASQEWVKTLAHALRVDRPRRDGGRDSSSTQDDVDDFLNAIDRLATLEHQADDAERALTSVAIEHARDFRELHLYAEIGRCLEAGADALKHASLLVREHVLADMIDG